MITDQRIIERFLLSLPVHLKSGAVGAHPDTITRDISSKGTFVQTANQLSLGEKVELIATLPSGVFLNATGKVVRVEQEGMAIQFKRPSIFVDATITQ